MRLTRKLLAIASSALAVSALSIIPATTAYAGTAGGLGVFYSPPTYTHIIWASPGGQNNEVRAVSGGVLPVWFQPTSGGYAQISQYGTNLCMQMWASKPYNGGYAVTETPCAGLTGQEWANEHVGYINGVQVQIFVNKYNGFCLSWDESAETFYARSCNPSQWYQWIYSEPA